jgi:FHS family L-fucose permease-like MFS transporter
MSTKKSIFIGSDGKNLAFVFMLVSSLFLLWGLCNGMIDVMDKHFQEELHLTLSQSAWVQFAHYLGYFLMSLPAGWLATRLGYKWGIILVRPK